MSKCFEDFCDEIGPRPADDYAEAFDVAISAMHLLFEPVDDAGMTYRQRDLVLAGIASRTPRNSRERQFAMEQAAVITEDVVVANAARHLSQRLGFLDIVRQRIKDSQAV